jgi:uncharacterized membrane protein
MKKLPNPKPTVASLFVVIAVIFGVYFTFSTPLLWGADETTQLGRAYQVSQGHVKPKFFGIFHGGGYGGYIPNNLLQLISYVNNDLTTHTRLNSNGVGEVNNPNGYHIYASKKLGPATTAYIFSNTAPYSPLAYIPSALGLRVGSALKLDIGNTIYLARLFDLATYVLLVWLSLRSLRKYKTKWIIFVIALLPMTLFQSAMITADGPTNATSLLLVALVIKGLLSKTELSLAEKILLGLATIGLPLLKPTYFPLSFLVLLIPSARLGISKRAAVVIKLVVLSLSLGLFTAWSYEARNITNSVRLVIPGSVWSTIDPTSQEHFLLHHPISYLATIFRTLILNDNAMFNQFFGLLGFNYVQIPGVSIAASFVAMLVALFMTDDLERRKTKITILAFLAAIVVCAGLMFTTFYITLTSVSGTVVGGIQGRYFIPLATPLLFFLGLLAMKFGLRPKEELDYGLYARLSYFIVMLVIGSLILGAAKYHYVTFG